MKIVVSLSINPYNSHNIIRLINIQFIYILVLLRWKSHVNSGKLILIGFFIHEWTVRQDR